MNNVYISIIIPVYNAEKYLRECINSILDQRSTYTDFEVILVDDGSTDSSLNICREYEKNNNLTVISQENKGPATARNNGLKKAAGKYILFVDSDDYIESNSLKKIVELCENQNEPDIFFVNGCKIYKDGRKVTIETDFDYTKLENCSQKEIFEYLSSRNKFHASPCLKMIKRSLLIDNDIEFEEGRRVEDLDWSMKCYLFAKTFGCYNDVYYYYRQEIATSNSSRFEDNSYNDFKYVIDKWIELSAQNAYTSIKESILKFACYEYIVLLVYCKDYVKKDIKWHRDRQFLLKYRDDNKSRLVRIACRLIGVGATSKLLNVYFQNR